MARRRPYGEAKLRYKDICKSSIRDFSVSYEVWKELVKNCVMWKAPLRKRRSVIKGGNEDQT